MLSSSLDPFTLFLIDKILLMQHGFIFSGLISVPQIQRLFMETRLLAYCVPPKGESSTFLEYDVLASDSFTFMASSTTSYIRSLLFVDSEPNLAVMLDLGYVGNTSLNSRAQLVDLKTKTVFAKNVNQVVTVSKKTRKPTPLPDWWVEKYRSWVPEDGHKLIVSIVETRSDAHKYKLKVAWSNTDGYGHTNYVAYLRFCYDAAMDAIQNGYLERFHGDIDSYETKKTSMSYKKECSAGDDLVVSVWPNEDNPYCLHFSIHKDEDLLYQCKIDFYESDLRNQESFMR